MRHVPAFPYAEHALELARGNYEEQDVEIATVLSARREVLQVEIPIAQVEAELRDVPGLAGTRRRLPGQRPGARVTPGTEV